MSTKKIKFKTGNIVKFTNRGNYGKIYMIEAIGNYITSLSYYNDDLSYCGMDSCLTENLKYMELVANSIQELKAQLL